MSILRTLSAILVIAASAALVPADPARADCPDGMVELNCGGLPVCKPQGASCCGAVACPPDQECTTCGTQTMCRRRGEGCPIGNLD
jgi:hypothetical protein